MNTEISPVRRAELAELHELNDPYLYQCLSGRKEMNAAEAVRIEKLTGGEIKRWMLRGRSWHLIWPELIGADGVPPVPVSESDPHASKPLAKLCESPSACGDDRRNGDERRQHVTPICLGPSEHRMRARREADREGLES